MGSQSKSCIVQVPRSSKLIYEDNDYSLYSVTLFKRVAESFKQAARSKGFQVSAWQQLWLYDACTAHCQRHNSAQRSSKPDKSSTNPCVAL